jgi:hypothetical protein
MIAARNRLGQPGPQSLPVSGLSEQSWLDWAVLDFNYQVETFKASVALGIAWPDWYLPTIPPLDLTPPPPLTPDPPDETPAE